MAKNKQLSITERAKIDVYHSEGRSSRFIAEKLGRSQTVVVHYLRDPSNYGKNCKGRVAKVLSSQDKRRILRLASNSMSSSSKLLAESGVKASKSTVLRLLKNTNYLKRLKVMKKPPLTLLRKQQRLEFARKHMTWDISHRSGENDWRRVVFSDEKKFNLDGPDGVTYYFHDLRKEEIFLERNHSKAGGIMVWGAISYYGTVELSFQNVRMTAVSYKAILQLAFPQLQRIFGPLRWTFQHDNAPIHTARVVKSFIQEQDVELLAWPPYSPDLNIIENVWGWLSRKVYEGGRQYDNVEALINRIKAAWNEISLEFIKSLYNSLPNRIFELIEKKGGSTHY